MGKKGNEKPKETQEETRFFLERQKKNLANAEASLNQTAKQLSMLEGVVLFLRQEIAEVEKEEKEDIK